MGSSKSEKRELLVFKGTKITQSDFRGLIALLLSSAFVLSLFIGNVDAIAALGPLSGSAATYYFHEKAMEREF